MRPSPRVPALGIAALLLLGACSGTTSTASPAGGTPLASAPASQAPESAAPASASPAPSLVAQVPADQIIRPGRLTACMDMPYPPLQYFDDQGNPIGVDVELLNEIAKRLGLEAVIENSVYDTIVAALKSGKCDVIMADQLITADRQKELNMLPYWKSAEVFVVPKGNPKAITDATTLCGHSAAGQTGALEIDALHKFDTDCKSAGKPGIDIQEFPKATDALQALQSGHVDVDVTSLATGGYFVLQNPDQFEIGYHFALTGDNLVGISNLPDKQALGDAVKAAMDSIEQDGTYASILAKYHFESGSILP
jgi:polar amino acid transport system substrate-binding protein